VTDQGSNAQLAQSGCSAIEPSAVESKPNLSSNGDKSDSGRWTGIGFCHFCTKVGSLFVRRGFLNKRTSKRVLQL
jgi:hypothetical protein